MPRTLLALSAALGLLLALPARAQTVEDGSDAAIGKDNTALVIGLIAERFAALDPKVTTLRRARDSWICGAVNVKNRDGLYIGERGFVVDVGSRFFGRVPEGPELMNPRADGFAEKERVRQLFFDLCLD
ncbi:hypothetical protein ASG52_00465 [Methylobacterium sp. Leaf456]|uniref:hypothetical protein n=1 Tax=Methylobacterium sp. Leaf456 TaxID=1736382 RepID=UPI0006FE6CD5|nr:hypothetical protein [Methylobacterium sp. Leaf456]KQT61399.1 hypothetical protein ASG52_00465 [Methylobacterium sp. Leaf456]